MADKEKIICSECGSKNLAETSQIIKKRFQQSRVVSELERLNRAYGKRRLKN